MLLRKIKDIILFFERNIVKTYLRIHGVRLGKDLKIKGFPYIRNRGEIVIGKKVRINSRISSNPIGGDTKCYFVTGQGARLEIDNSVAISNSAINCYEFIKLEENVMIGGGCKIYDTDFHSLNIDERVSDDRSTVKTKPIHIKRNAFIGGHSIILKGVTIGNNSIVGAGSVVSSNIPSNEIWAGNPARFIKSIHFENVNI